ncbi:MAG TPA: GNAT family N-acetyltransferase [Lautropia sp.]|nr:GNAT family N-acetyltransferase [Lautropia sp.]
MTLHFRRDDLSGPEIRNLIDMHLAHMRACSPACSVHAMPVERLREEDVTFWSAWEGERLAGCGALKALGSDHGELKSMRTAPNFLRQGVGERMLLHLLQEARARSYTRVSLETGRSPPFAAAQALYTKHGFAECGPFADYAEDPFSLFMTRTLQASPFRK